MPKDIPWISKKKCLSIIDCGAFNGDTLLAFMKNKFKIMNYFAFEPDKNNYEKLQLFVRRNDLHNVFCFNNATWEKSTLLNLLKGGGETNTGAYITKSNSSQVQKVFAIKLDSIFSNIDIDLIKMDIEGAEIPTLTGLKYVIRKKSPFLAISAYHKPADLWELPLLIKKLNKKYNFYLRTYGQQTFETVLYCVPD